LGVGPIPWTYKKWHVFVLLVFNYTKTIR
jgi:hypothetical protein